MNKYEGMFLLDTSRCAKDWDKVVAHVRDILEKNGSEIESCEKWAERKLAFEIGHHKRAVYLLVIFVCPGLAIGRIKRACQLSDVIVRVLFTVFDEKAKIAMEPKEPATTTSAATAVAAVGAETKAEDVEGVEALEAEPKVVEEEEADLDAGDEKEEKEEKKEKEDQEES